MAQTKIQKEKVLEELKEKTAKQKAIVFIDFTGLKVKDFSNLRKKLKAAENEVKVTKKTLMGIIFKNAKLEIDAKKLPGEVALVFGYKDVISPAKTLWQFSQQNQNLKILGGFIENKFKKAEEIITLAQLPTREELLTKLVGSINSPISNFVYVLQANMRNFVYIISQIKPST